MNVIKDFVFDTIYNENCLDTMKRLPDKSIDLILTDPPYGINIPYDYYNDTRDNWEQLMSNVIPEMKRVAKMCIFTSGGQDKLPYYYKNHPPDWLMCWYKGAVSHWCHIGYNDWESLIVYGKRIPQQFMHDHFQTKTQKRGSHSHPCAKPEEWAEYLISRVARNDKITVYDPFAGSGTVCVVAKKLGHQYIGSEISTTYCNQALNRLNSV